MNRRGNALRRALYRRVVVLGVVAVLAICASVALAVRLELQRTQAQMNEATRSAAAAFDTYFADLERDLAGTAATMGTGDAGELRWLLARRLELRGAGHFDHAGRLLRAEGRPGVGRPEFTHVEDAAPTEDSAWLGPVTFDGSPAPRVDIAVRMPDGGMLVTCVDLTSLWNLAVRARFGDGGAISVIDDDGRVVAHRRLQLMADGARFEDHADFGADDLSDDGLHFGHGSGGRLVVAAGIPLTTAPWFVVAEQPAREIVGHLLAPVLGSTSALAVLVLIVLGTLRFTRARLERPLQDLYEGVRELRSGGQRHRVTVTYDDELGELAGAFNDMSETLDRNLRGLEREVTERERAHAELAQAHAQLEERVDARTAALKAANDALQGEIEQRRRAELELRRATQRAEDANHAKSRFLANMSHEIRTPMNAVLGLTRLSLDRELPDDVRENLLLVQRSGDHLLHLINELLDLSRVEAGHLVLRTRPVRVGPLTRELADELRPTADERGIELRCDVAIRDDLVVLVDGARLRQVLVNLVGNAIKFTREGHVALHIDATHHPGDDTTLHFAVTDTGVGIPAERVEAIFDAFEQVDGARQDELSGTGLGLAISARIVEAMGGRIEVESAPGQGSTFRFDVSVRTTEVEVTGERPPMRLEDLATRRLRILLAEDNPINQRVAIAVLTRRGHSVEVVADGRAAVRRATTEAFDLVLMDVQMPDMDGIEATRALRSAQATNARGEPLPIIAMTAHAMQEDRDRCLAAGMDAFVSKPFDFAELLQVVEGRG